MKTALIIFAFMALSTAAIAQNSQREAVTEKVYTSLKPNDVQPAVFNSRQELEAKVEGKKNNIIALIKANENDPVKFKYYREELWRFENAVVQEPKK